MRAWGITLSDTALDCEDGGLSGDSDSWQLFEANSAIKLPPMVFYHMPVTHVIFPNDPKRLPCPLYRWGKWGTEVTPVAQSHKCNQGHMDAEPRACTGTQSIIPGLEHSQNPLSSILPVLLFVMKIKQEDISGALGKLWRALCQIQSPTKCFIMYYLQLDGLGSNLTSATWAVWPPTSYVPPYASVSLSA